MTFWNIFCRTQFHFLKFIRIMLQNLCLMRLSPFFTFAAIWTGFDVVPITFPFFPPRELPLTNFTNFSEFDLTTIHDFVSRRGWWDFLWLSHFYSFLFGKVYNLILLQCLHLEHFVTFLAINKQTYHMLNVTVYHFSKLLWILLSSDTHNILYFNKRILTTEWMIRHVCRSWDFMTQILKPKSRMHFLWASIRSWQFSSPFSIIQASRGCFVSGHAQHGFRGFFSSVEDTSGVFSCSVGIFNIL